MAFCHNTERRNLKDGGEGSQPQGGEKAAPPLRRAPRGTFCGVPSSRSCPAPSRHHRSPFGDLATAPQHAHSPLWDYPCPQGSPSGGAPDQGWGSLEVSSKMSSGNPAPGPGWGADPGRARSCSLAFRAHGPGCSALRVKQGRATRRLGLACAQGRIPGGYAGLQGPGPHFMPEKPMRRLKTLCNSSRKILSRDLYLRKA